MKRLLILALLACEPRAAEQQTQQTTPVADSTKAAASHSDAMITEAENVVSFLAGDADFDQLSLADTVELYVADEGGGARSKVDRDTLGDRNAWRVGGDRAHSFVPSGLLTRMTAKAGAHFRCQEVALESRVASLVAVPHVGVKLEPPDAASCLQTWNATFVFDTTGARPRLTAAVWDQWEW